MIMKKNLIKAYIFFFNFLEYLTREYLLYIPSHFFRRIIAKIICKSVGKNSFIFMGVEIRKGKNIKIGSNCVINKRVLLDGRGGDLIIGDNVDISQETNIWTLTHDIHCNDHSVIGANVIIEDNVWIASRVTILPGVKVGKGAVIATNSVVTKDIESMSVVGGNPATKIGTRKNNLKYKLLYKPPFDSFN